MSGLRTFAVSDIKFGLWDEILPEDTRVVAYADHEHDVSASVAAAVQAEREKWERLVEQLRDAAAYAEDCLNPDTDPRSSGMALHKLRAALAAVRAAQGAEQKEKKA